MSLPQFGHFKTRSLSVEPQLFYVEVPNQFWVATHCRVIR